MNAIELLKEDHKKVRALLSELESSTTRATSRRTELVAQIERELTIHARIEEEIFYPAFKEAGEKNEDDKMYFEALEEHRAVEDMVLPDLKRTDPSTEQFSGRAKVLKELVEHHAREEEKEMFPRARKLFSATELRDLGASMEAMKAELLPGPAPKAEAKGSKGLLGSMLSALAAPATVSRSSSAKKSSNDAGRGKSEANARSNGNGGAKARSNGNGARKSASASKKTPAASKSTAKKSTGAARKSSGTRAAAGR
jgi:hemerythrin superfamily protein